MRGGLAAATLVTGLALATPASAGEPTETLRRLFEQANHILSAPDVTGEGRLIALRALVREAFDAREAAALALGREWTARSAEERDEFTGLYGDVIEGAYLGGVGSRARLHADGIRVTFESESVQGRSAVVRTTLETRGGSELPIEYRMGRRDRGWAVVDVVVEGLSLAGSYRAQIQRVMQTGTYADVVARLREKASTATVAAIGAAKSAALATTHDGAPAPVLVASAAAVSDAPPVPSRLTSAPSAAVEAPPPATPATVDPTPEPVSPPDTAPPSVSAPGTSFWLQVGAFRNTDAASRVVERLRHYSVMVATGGQRSAPLARVLVGPFTSRAAAASMLKELAAGGYRAFIAVE